MGNPEIRPAGRREGRHRVDLRVPAGRRAELTAADKERIYYVLRGSVTLSEENGTAHRLDPEDMIYIPPGEKRSMSVNGSVAARAFVIVAG